VILTRLFADVPARDRDDRAHPDLVSEESGNFFLEPCGARGDVDDSSRFIRIRKRQVAAVQDGTAFLPTSSGDNIYRVNTGLPNQYVINDARAGLHIVEDAIRAGGDVL